MVGATRFELASGCAPPKHSRNWLKTRGIVDTPRAEAGKSDLRAAAKPHKH